MKNFFKGILVGIGGVSPGLSGSVMMVIFGIYEKTIESIGTFFKNPKKNFVYLFPLLAGMGIGVLSFGKIVNFLLNHFEMYTRFAFLGLVLGTLPLFYKEIKKNGFEKKYYLIIIIAFIFGSNLLYYGGISQLVSLNISQSIMLGFIIAASTIIPGVDSAVILSSLGLYEIFVCSVANFNLTILLPALVGVGFGVLIFSFIMNKLIKKFYTITYSIIFGLFLSIIPSVIEGGYSLGFNFDSLLSIILVVLGFFVSFFMGSIKKEEN